MKEKEIDYKETYVAFTVNINQVECHSFDNKKDTSDHLKKRNFTARGNLYFENETQLRTLRNFNGMGANAIIAPAVELHRGEKRAVIFKIVRYSSFSGYLADDEEVFRLNDPDIQSSPNFTYYMTNTDKIFKLDERDGSVREMKMEEERRIKILGQRYYIEYLREKRDTQYDY